MKRYDIRGRELADVDDNTQCFDCGMGLLHASEFHPYEACEEFKATHDSRKVWARIMPLFRERIHKVAACREASNGGKRP